MSIDRILESVCSFMAMRSHCLIHMCIHGNRWLKSNFFYIVYLKDVSLRPFISQNLTCQKITHVCVDSQIK